MWSFPQLHMTLFLTQVKYLMTFISYCENEYFFLFQTLKISGMTIEKLLISLYNIQNLFLFLFMIIKCHIMQFKLCYIIIISAFLLNIKVAVHSSGIKDGPHNFDLLYWAWVKNVCTSCFMVQRNCFRTFHILNNLCSI